MNARQATGPWKLTRPTCVWMAMWSAVMSLKPISAFGFRRMRS